MTATVLMALAMPAATAVVVALVYLAPSMIDRLTRRRRMAAATRAAEDLKRRWAEAFYADVAAEADWTPRPDAQLDPRWSPRAGDTDAR